MKSLSDIIQSKLPFIEEKLGNQTFTFNDEQYACHPGSLGELQMLGDGGFEKVPDLILVVRTNVFTDNVRPQPRQKISYRDIVYRVEKVIANPNDAFVKLICVSANKGV